MDTKKNADLLRKAADKSAELADLIDQMDVTVPDVSRELPRALSRQFREDADKLDPPQPEWQDGDLARDKNDNVWRYNGVWWFSAGGATARTEELLLLYGPLEKLIVVDPTKNEVKLSLEGIDTTTVEPRWANKEEDRYHSLSTKILIRVAKAVREQSGKE